MCLIAIYIWICIEYPLHLLYLDLWQWAGRDIVKCRNQCGEDAVLCQLGDWLNRQWQWLYKIWWYQQLSTITWLLEQEVRDLCEDIFFLLRTDERFTFVCWPFLRVEDRNWQSWNLDRCFNVSSWLYRQHDSKPPASTPAICQTMNGPS